MAKDRNSKDAIPSTRRELVRLLTDHGFELVREGRHAIYRKGSVTVPVAHSPVISSRQARLTLVQVRNANSAQIVRRTGGAASG